MMRIELKCPGCGDLLSNSVACEDAALGSVCRGCCEVIDVGRAIAFGLANMPLADVERIKRLERLYRSEIDMCDDVFGPDLLHQRKTGKYEFTMDGRHVD